MFFRYTFIVSLGLHDLPETTEIENLAPPSIKLSLRPIKEEEMKPDYSKHDWVAIVSTEESLSENVAKQFDDIGEKPTQAVKDVTNRVGGRLHSFVIHFLKIVRWRNGLCELNKPIRCALGFEWSIDGVKWTHAKDWVRAVISISSISQKYTKHNFEEIKKMLNSEDYEPLGHELWHESWILRHNSPRSALVLGVSALEVGVKAFITKLVPPSEWLCFEMPAPPVVRILEEYLPKLPVKLKINEKAFIPEIMIRTLRKAVNMRNTVAHKGIEISSDETLNEILTSIQMTLYLLDYYAGHSWALHNLRDSGIHNLIMNEIKATPAKLPVN